MGLAFRQENHLEGKFVVLYAGAHGISNDLQVVLEAARQLSGDERIRFVSGGRLAKKKPTWSPAHRSSIWTMFSFCRRSPKPGWAWRWPRRMPAWRS